MVNLNEKDDIVISGISGVFPVSGNVKEFENNLYNKVNMVNDEESRWKYTHPLLPKLSGKIPQLNKFDSTFFGIYQVQADYMDPQSRILIEEAFKALMDAGVNPTSLRGSNTGVYIGACFSDSQSAIFFDSIAPSGFGITGCSKAMFANRISYILGLNGPSLLCDSACSSSMYAFDMAFQALRSGIIDSAIVGGSNILLHPQMTISFANLGILALNGQCCPFDKEANGYTRAEAVTCVYLQRKSAAKRVYATVVHCGTNCDGFKYEGITFPSRIVQEKLMRQVYEKANINLNDLGYMEAHCTGTLAGDPEECAAIDKAICQRRDKPLLVGSVKSNCGHTEAASGLCSLVKVIIAMEKNLIPPNINFRNLRKEISALREGRLKVVTEATALPKPYVGLNSFGFGGTNGHLVMRQFDKEKTDYQSHLNTLLPRLVTWSGRTEANCNEFFSNLSNQPLDEEFLALAQAAQSNGIQGMVFRGYSVLKYVSVNKNPIVLKTCVQHNGGIKRPLAWVFSGMGSQWVGMGKSLMQLPTCKQSIEKCHNILLPMGIDIIKIVTSDDPNIFDNIMHSFTGIAAIQIALIDVLKELHITPDLLIGHSVGELGCAYADNCFTAEQTILAAYYRGKVSREMSKIRGTMIAVGMGYKDIKALVPPTTDVACHNSSESCTISGPQEDIAEFVELLKSKNIFAKEIPTSKIAFHSRYISQLGPNFLRHLKKLIPNPVLRSKKWISTSAPRSKWLSDECRYCSAEYHTNNLLNSVFFEEALNFIPKNALTIEIAPHALLNVILQSGISDGVHIGLTKRYVEDGILHFLNALGSLYVNGLEIRIDKLYPMISWPVSRGTPNLSSLVKFDHTRDYFVYKFNDLKSGNGIETFSIRLTDQKNQYLAGHAIDDQILIPAGFYLECVWRTFAALKGVDFENLSVEFENVKFLRETVLNTAEAIELITNVQRGSGKFEVTESSSLVVTGFVRDIAAREKSANIFSNRNQENCFVLDKKAIYKEFDLRGYQCSSYFESIEQAVYDGSYGKVQTQRNWVVVIDSMMQLNVLGNDMRSLKVLTKARSIRINPQYHKYVSEQSSMLEIFHNKFQNKTICGGIEMVGLTFNTIQRKKTREAILEKYQFVSHFPAPEMGLNDVARCCIQLVQEIERLTSIQIVEFTNNKCNNNFLTNLKQAVINLPLICATYVLCHKSKDLSVEEIEGVRNISLDEDEDAIHPSLLVLNALDLSSLKSRILEMMDSKGFLIIRDDRNLCIEKYKCPSDFIAIAFFPTNSETIVLLQRINKNQSTNSDDMHIFNMDDSHNRFEWLPKLQELCQTSSNVILVSRNDKFNGIRGLVSCLRVELASSHIRCVLIDDPEAPVFDPKLDFYKKQLKLNLALNVYHKGKWGTYRHLLLDQNYPAAQCSNHVYGSILRIGDFSSLKWIEGPLQKSDANVKIAYSSLNFRDVMIASEHLPVDVLRLSREERDCVFGLEYSGIEVNSGKAIMGVVPRAGLASYLNADTTLSWQVPQGWSLSEAATVPVAYLTVYYAFFSTVDIRTGKSILIHAGSSGVGIAAIRVALAYGLEVYTTVSAAKKKAFLLQTFPTLKENHIGNSRNTSFEGIVMKLTNGKGVDFVLNCLLEDQLVASLRCLCNNGNFLQIGKMDIFNDNSLPLGAFPNELSFHTVNIDHLFVASKEFVDKMKGLIDKDIEKGIIKPLPVTIFKAHELQQAFTYLISGKHVGKVIIQIREPAHSEVSLPMPVLRRVYFSPNSVYIVVGGLGGVGLELVDWMSLRGARKIVLSSSSGITSDYQKLRIFLWKSYSCQVVVNTSDIATETGCLQLLKDAMELGPLEGIFNLAAVIRDSIFENQTVENFQLSFQPKAFATMHLDQISRKLCPNLKYFVIYSSISCGRGNGGQTNYGMANSIMERIIEDRIAHGLSGKAIQWGAIGEVGLLANMGAGNDNVDVCGTLPQRIRSCFQVLDALLLSTEPIVCSTVVAAKKQATKVQSPLEFVLNTLSINDIKTISMTSTLPELGMDSLMGIEIKQTLERDYNIVLNAADVRSLTFDKLKELSTRCGELSNHGVQQTPENDVNLRLLFYYVGSNFSCRHTFDQINDVKKGIPIIILPGIDGYSNEIWRQIGKGLKYPAYVLQLKYLSDLNNMEGLIHFVYERTTELLNDKDVKSFQILAYSYGCMIGQYTLELLENAGYMGKAIFIDGSARMLECIMDKLKNDYSEDDVVKLTLNIILNIMVPTISSGAIEGDLRQRHFAEDMLLFARETLQKNVVENINDLMEYIETILMKMRILHRSGDALKTTRILQSTVLLLKSSTPIVMGMDDSYGLSSLTAHPVDSVILDGNHQTILQNTRIVDQINNYFS